MSARYSFTTEIAPRQAEVLALIAEGLSNKEIADELGVSRATVVQHTKDIYLRLGARSRAHCVHLAHCMRVPAVAADELALARDEITSLRRHLHEIGVLAADWGVNGAPRGPRAAFQSLARLARRRP